MRRSGPGEAHDSGVGHGGDARAELEELGARSGAIRRVTWDVTVLRFAAVNIGHLAKCPMFTAANRNTVTSQVTRLIAPLRAPSSSSSALASPPWPTPLSWASPGPLRRMDQRGSNGCHQVGATH